MYVARNKNGEVFMYRKKPTKHTTMWRGSERFLIKDEMLPKSINPKWEDSEPIEVKLVRKNK